MAATIPNIAKGRINQFALNVENNTPTDAGFIVVLLQDTGLDTLDELRDFDTLAAILGGSNTEVTVASYARLVLDDTDVGATTVDDSGNAQTFDVGDFDFGALESGESVQASVVCYAPDTAGADSTLIPCHVTRLDAAIPLNGEVFHWRTPNGLWSAEEPA